MEIATAILEHNFDRDMLEQIDSLRMIRLQLAERMLSDLDQTALSLTERGLIEYKTLDRQELQKELMQRIATLRERIARPHVVYADEVSLYVDLLEHAQAAE